MHTADELKQWGYAPGDYLRQCVSCGTAHTADKRASRCIHCAKDLAKALAQETAAQVSEADEPDGNLDLVSRLDGAINLTLTEEFKSVICDFNLIQGGVQISMFNVADGRQTGHIVTYMEILLASKYDPLAHVLHRLLKKVTTLTP